MSGMISSGRNGSVNGVCIMYGVCVSGLSSIVYVLYRSKLKTELGNKYILANKTVVVIIQLPARK